MAKIGVRVVHPLPPGALGGVSDAFVTEEVSDGTMDDFAGDSVHGPGGEDGLYVFLRF